MRDKKKEQKEKILAYLLFVLFISMWVGLALIVKKCIPDSPHDELYDEYLESEYSGVDRYEPY